MGFAVVVGVDPGRCLDIDPNPASRPTLAVLIALMEDLCFAVTWAGLEEVVLFASVARQLGLYSSATWHHPDCR